MILFLKYNKSFKGTRNTVTYFQHTEIHTHLIFLKIRQKFNKTFCYAIPHI